MFMAEIKHKNHTFKVANFIKEKYPELIEMVLQTQSMDNEEKQYWFDILPSMNNEQIDRLYEILDTERKKLEELEKKYEREIKALNEKSLIDWQNTKSQETQKMIKKQEAEDKDDEEAVSKLLDEL